MKISVIQFKPEFGDLEGNFHKIASYSESIESDILLFPELAFSGYDFSGRDEAMDLSEEYLKGYTGKLQEISTKLNKIICTGFAEKSSDRLHNSCCLLFPNSDYSTTYHKVHLFFRERFVFDESEKGFFVVNYPDSEINIGPMICYDWRFPEASRTLALKGADLILCPSNLVTKVWHISTPSRALENKVYLAVANRTGIENRNGNELEFNGGSVIHGFDGSTISKAGFDSEEVITAEIFPEMTRDKSFNEYNDIFTDRRPNFYI
ncbi:MAG: carbon-nitrogen hydrolase [Candidatus Kapabacteria bacterium]|nr:carbon-nitrogen hydrolase [Ignavibacteriota bacterium]MCW5883556.1 carbon-nitrogen hydrolase [Candidatus Kapabacteria bacterium]